MVAIFSQWWTDEHTNFEPDDSCQHPPSLPSGLHRLLLSKWILWSQHVRGISFKSVSTFPDSFLNLQCHIQMLAGQREFVMCHWWSLISLLMYLLTFSSYLLHLAWHKRSWRSVVWTLFLSQACLIYMVIFLSSRQMRWRRQRAPSSFSSSPQTLQRSSSPSGYTSPTFHSASVTRTFGKCLGWVSLFSHTLVMYFVNCKDNLVHKKLKRLENTISW